MGHMVVTYAPSTGNAYSLPSYGQVSQLQFGQSVISRAGPEAEAPDSPVWSALAM